MKISELNVTLTCGSSTDTVNFRNTGGVIAVTIKHDDRVYTRAQLNVTEFVDFLHSVSNRGDYRAHRERLTCIFGKTTPVLHVNRMSHNVGIILTESHIHILGGIING